MLLKTIKDNIPGALIGTVVTAFFFYLQTYREPYHQIAYYFYEPSLIAYKSESASSIQIFDKDGVEINGAIYAMRLAIWNSGTETIPYQEVLLPVKFEEFAVERILSSSITNTIEKRGDFSLLSPETTPDSFALQWKDFDPGAGVEIEIIFERKSSLSQAVLRGDAIARQFQIKGELVKGELVRGEVMESESIFDRYIFPATGGLLIVIGVVVAASALYSCMVELPRAWKNLISEEESDASSVPRNSFMTLILASLCVAILVASFFDVSSVMLFLRPSLSPPF